MKTVASFPAPAQALAASVVRPRLAVATWCLDTFRGRLAEISGTHDRSALTLVFRLVLEAQRRAEPVGWIGHRGSTFYPPDVAAAGVDLGALAVVRLPEARRAVRAADHLVRSGGFGLVVLDIGADDALPLPAQMRLTGLAKKHDAALVCLTVKASHRPSLGSLVSLRAEATRGARAGDRFRCAIHVLKDKRHGPGWTHVEDCHGPDGLR